MTTTPCPRNLPQHFNGCACASPARTTAEVEADLTGAVDDYFTHGHVHLPGLGDISRARPGGPGTPVEDMERISIEGSDAERGLLASNVNAPAAVFDRLSVDRHTGVRAAVAANESAPASALNAIVSQPNGPTTMEMRALISNANTPAETLDAMALPFDENEWHYPLSAEDLARHMHVSDALLYAIREGSTYDHQARGAATTRFYNRRYEEMTAVINDVHGSRADWDTEAAIEADWIRRADEIQAAPDADQPSPEQRRAEIEAIVRRHLST